MNPMSTSLRRAWPARPAPGKSTVCPAPGKSKVRPAPGQPTVRDRTGRAAAVLHRVPARLLAAATVCLLLPAVAQAHGPVAPAASRYLARPTEVPAGLRAKAIDGDLRMWLQVPPHDTVIVLDYRGAPYLRFSASGVSVNHNSSMYYLNQTPVPATPPLNLTSTTPPSWHPVTGGHTYEWHDGRLHALAAVALAPGVSYVGRWNVPLRINGHLATISGGLWHADDPSLVWFWPIVVIVMCVLAAWRVRRARLDFFVSRTLAGLAVAGITAAGLGVELHGRPGVTVLQLVELAAILAFVGWAAVRVASGRVGYFTCFLIGVGALWAGGEIVTTLIYGYVLIALPAFVARAACVVCLGTGVGLVLLVFRLADRADTGPLRRRAVVAEPSPDGQLSPARGAPR